MADTPAVPPAETPQPASTPQPNYAARSALRIMRKAERSLSPWARRALQASQPGVVQRSPEAGSGGGSMFNTGRRPMALTSQTNMGLFNKAQRVSDQAGVIQLRPLARSGAGLVQLSSQISGHFPDIARKYESRSQPAAESIQRSELSLSSNASAGAGESVSASSSLPDLGGNDSEPSITFSPETSLTGIMASRLQAFRDAGKMGAPTGDIQSSSPRQISRMAADVAARATRTDKAPARRGSVEEIGAKSEGPSSEPAEPKTVVNESVQRKPAAPSTPSKPAPSAKAAPAQSYSEPAWMAQPDPYDIPDRPELPSLTQELAQRYIAQRSIDRALPKTSSPDDGLPSFLRKDSSGTPAFHLTGRTPQGSSDVQRKPEPSAPARPTPPATPSVDRPLVTPRPTVQRSEATPPASTEPAPSDSEPPAAATPSVQRTVTPATPSIQRTPSSERPASPKPAAPSVQRKAVVGRRVQPKSAPATPRSAPIQRPAVPGRPTIQRQTDVSAPGLDQPLVNRTAPAASTPVSSPEVSAPPPTVQRSVESASSTPQSPAPEKPQASVARPATPSIQRSPDPTPSVTPRPPESGSTDLPLQRKPASSSTFSNTTPSEPSVERPSASAAPTVQRQLADLPVRAQPTPSSASTASSSSLGQSVVQRAQASSHLTLSQPSATIQRRVENAAPQLDLPAPRRVSAPRSSGLTGASTPTPTIQRSPKPDIPAGPFNAPLVSPVRASGGTVQRQLDAPVTPLTLAMADHTPDSFTSTRPAASTPTVQRSVEASALAEPVMSMPRLPLVAQRAPTSVQRERDTSSQVPESSTSSETPKASLPAASGPDLQDLARRIYPLLKRMLAIERERR